MHSFRIAAATHVLGMSRAEELVEAADALLARGVYSYSLGELATVQNPRHVSIAEVAPLFRAALRELGLPLLSVEDALRAVASDWIWKMAEGACEPARCVNWVWGLNLLWSNVHSFHAANEVIGWRELLQWAHDYEIDVALADDHTADEGERERWIAEADSRVIGSAVRWLLDGGLGRIDPSWLTWHDGCVRRIAQGIADERAFDRLPILHDALIDAGCDNEGILEHCREPGEHRARCLVVDLFLGKA
jgi:hypothetical protein